MISTTAHYLEVCEQAARAGAAALLDWMGRFTVREKGPADLVTEADLASREAICQTIFKHFPEHGFQDEETAEITNAECPLRWVVDPLDGTTNYVHGAPNFSVSIALVANGEPLVAAVLDPMAEESFTAAKGGGAFLNGRPIQASPVRSLSDGLIAASFPPRIERGSAVIQQFLEVLYQAQSVRRTGSSALNLSYVAAGRFDGFWAGETRAWDIAAGVLLVQEAHGVVTGLDGKPVDLDSPHVLAASTPEMHRQLLGALAL